MSAEGHLKRELLVFRQRASQLVESLNRVSMHLKRGQIDDQLIENYSNIAKQLSLLEADLSDRSQIGQFILQPLTDDYDCGKLGVMRSVQVSKDMAQLRHKVSQQSSQEEMPSEQDDESKTDEHSRLAQSMDRFSEMTLNIRDDCARHQALARRDRDRRAHIREAQQKSLHRTRIVDVSLDPDRLPDHLQFATEVVASLFDPS